MVWKTARGAGVGVEVGSRVGLAVTVTVAVGGISVQVSAAEVGGSEGTAVELEGTVVERIGPLGVAKRDPLQADKISARSHNP